MANKTGLQKGGINKIKPGVNQIDKKDTRKRIPEKVADKKQKKSSKKSSALLAASIERSAVDAVHARSSKDVRGSSGLANTATIISYD